MVSTCMHLAHDIETDRLRLVGECEAEGGDGVVKRGHGGEGGDGGDSGGGDACGSTRADAPSPTAQLPTATGARDSAKPFPMACLSVVARQAARIVSGSILSRHAARTCERAACVDIRGVVFYFHVYKGPREASTFTCLEP